MKITNTKAIEQHARGQYLVYAPSKFGKTTLAGTLPGKVLLLASEDGLVSLRDKEIDVWQLEEAGDLREAYKALRAKMEYDFVAVDSLTEVAEMVLAAELDNNADGRKAYGEMAKSVLGFVRALKQLPCGLYVTAHADKVRDEATGNLVHGPAFPGNMLGQKIPYLFDEVFTIRVGEDSDGKPVRSLQTRGDERYLAGDRSGALEQFEPMNLGAVEEKIRAAGRTNKSATAAKEKK